jgi:photosystem II stability/assembly factor-like uncharacterized protein
MTLPALALSFLPACGSVAEGPPPGPSSPHWAVLPTGPLRPLTAVWGSSATDIYAVGDAVVHSGDHGATWQVQTTPMIINPLTSVSGTGPGDVYAMSHGELDAGDAYSELYDTKDGGRTWTQVAYPQRSDLPWPAYVWGAGSASLFVLQNGGKLTNTTDRGATFPLVTLPLTTPMPMLSPYFGTTIGGSSPSDVYLTAGAYVGDGDATVFAILHSADQGASWALSPVTEPGTGVWASPTDAFVASDQSLLHSVDHGAHWTTIPMNANLTFAGATPMWGSGAGDLHVLDFVGNDHFSTDDGQTWTTLPLPNGLRALGLWGAAANDIYAVGTAPDDTTGVILHYGN